MKGEQNEALCFLSSGEQNTSQLTETYCKRKYSEPDDTDRGGPRNSDNL
jgi:hypothetical protein